MPLALTYRPSPRFLMLGEGFADPVEPARFPHHVLRFRNQPLAERLGLGALTSEEWERAFARFEPLLCNLHVPLALRYHGHQFGVYNPALGDGRGFLFAQVVEAGTGRLLDLATKGSGTTPWSRGGDGRLTLRGGVREVLATEMLEALGVRTSRSLSLFETGEALYRGDEPSPTRSSVLVRVGWSHVRFGTFQRLAHAGDEARLRRLVRFCALHYLREVDPALEGAALAVAFLRAVAERTARLVAQWMAAGFVHGVLNTDNMTITGESFDYGPYRFLPTFDPGFVAAYFDHGGRYAYGRQPSVALWNLRRLAEALAPLASAPELDAALAVYAPAYEVALGDVVARRLGLTPRDPDTNRALAEATFGFLQASQIGFERFFFDGIGGLRPARLGRSPEADRYASAEGRALAALAQAFEPAGPWDDAYFAGEGPETLLVPDVEAVWRPLAEHDDARPFDAKIARIRRMARALALAP